MTRKHYKLFKKLFGKSVALKQKDYLEKEQASNNQITSTNDINVISDNDEDQKPCVIDLTETDELVKPSLKRSSSWNGSKRDSKIQKLFSYRE